MADDQVVLRNNIGPKNSLTDNLKFPVSFVQTHVTSIYSSCMNTIGCPLTVVQGNLRSVTSKLGEGIYNISSGVVNTFDYGLTAAVTGLSVTVDTMINAVYDVKKLTETVPSLMKPTPSLVLDIAKETAFTYGVYTVSYMASFSLPQILLTVTDSSLDVLGKTVKFHGAGQKSLAWNGVEQIHKTTSSIRILGTSKARRELAGQMDEANNFGVVLLLVVSSKVMRQLGALMILKTRRGVMQWKELVEMNMLEVAVGFLLVINMSLLFDRVYKV